MPTIDKQFKMYSFHSLCTIFAMCCIILTITITNTVTALQEQQQQPYQYSLIKRRFHPETSDFGGYSGHSERQSSSLSSSDIIKFPEDGNTGSLLTSRDDDTNNDDNRHLQRSMKNKYGARGVLCKLIVELRCKDHDLILEYELPGNFPEIESYDDLYKRMDEESIAALQLIQPRSGESVERSLGVRPTPANCIPELTVVPLELADSSVATDPTIIVFPSCTRVKRCSGCCNTKLLSCQAIANETISFEVIKSQYQGGSKIKFLNKEIVTVEEHKKCKCECRKKAEHCIPRLQIYNKSQCLCICTNEADKDKCLKDNINLNKIWDPNTCSCQCRDDVSRECSTGLIFDETLCSCIETAAHRNTQLADRKRFYLKPSIYVPETPATRYETEASALPSNG